MKIGLVCPYSINEHGGVLEVVLALKDGLQKRGHEVRIITPQPRRHDGDPPKDVIFAGTSVDFRTLSFSDTTSQVSSTADNDKIDAMLAREKFDILNFHEPWMPLLSRQLLQRSKCVNIGTFHAKVTTAMTSRAILKVVAPYLKSVLNYLHALTAVSDSGAEYVVEMTKEPVAIIPNGIDLTKYRKLSSAGSSKKERPMILYVNRLENRKGVRYLLQAFKLFSQDNPDAELIIAGDGPDRERLEMMTDDLKLRNVSFLGFISEDLKKELLSKADLFCSPALFGESFGVVLLEAMSTGAVTIAGNNSGYMDVMQGVGGISIVNPRDTEEFARRMNLLMHERPLRDLWQKWASEYVQQFDYRHVVQQYEEFYKDAIKQHAAKT